MPCDARSFKPTTPAVESFGHLGEDGYDFVDEIASHAVGGKEGGSFSTKKGVTKERLLQILF